MHGGLTVLRNYYQKVSNVLIAVMMSSKKKQTSWTYGSTLVPLGLAYSKLMILTYHVLCTLKVLTNIAVGLTLPC